MKVLIPVDVTESNLTSLNIAEDDHAEWDAGVTYARGDFVISTATHSVYQSLTTSNLANDPDLEQVKLNDPLIENPNPQNWSLIGATNPWRLFDEKPSRIATNDGSIVIEFEPVSFIAGIGGFNVTGDSVRVEVYAGVDKIYDQTKALRDESGVIDWLTYFTSPFINVQEFVFLDLPVLGTPRIVVTISGSGTVSAGQIVFARAVEFGKVTVNNTGFNGIDYSYVEVDQYGDLSTVRRPSTRLFDINVIIDRNQLSRIVQRLNEIRGGEPTVWVGSEDSALALIAYGYYRSYRVIYEGSYQAEIAIQIQGVI